MIPLNEAFNPKKLNEAVDRMEKERILDELIPEIDRQIDRMISTLYAEYMRSRPGGGPGMANWMWRTGDRLNRWADKLGQAGHPGEVGTEPVEPNWLKGIKRTLGLEHATLEVYKDFQKALHQLQEEMRDDQFGGALLNFSTSLKMMFRKYLDAALNKAMPTKQKVGPKYKDLLKTLRGDQVGMSKDEAMEAIRAAIEQGIEDPVDIFTHVVSGMKPPTPPIPPPPPPEKKPEVKDEPKTEPKTEPKSEPKSAPEPTPEPPKKPAEPEVVSKPEAKSKPKPIKIKLRSREEEKNKPPKKKKKKAPPPPPIDVDFGDDDSDLAGLL